MTEALAIDQVALLDAVVDAPGASLRSAAEDARDLGILKRMQRMGAAFAERDDRALMRVLATHPSDTVRGWACFASADRDDLSPADVLKAIRPFADDAHFAVREWSWMAVRPSLVRNLDESIRLLATWSLDGSEYVRRFASEALRPRGVWASHIAAPRPSGL